MLLKNKKDAYSLILLVLICFNGYSQYSAEFKTNKEKYPESNIVRLLDEEVISIKLKNNDLEIAQSFIEEDLFLDESAIYGSKRALNFSSFFELQSVEATSYEYKDGKYKTYKVEDFVEKDELENSFHDDSKSLNFIYPNLSIGSKTKLEYTEIVKNPRFLSPIYFGDFFPIQHKKVTLIADKDIEFRFEEFNTEAYKIKFQKEEKRGNIIYTWELSDIDKFKSEQNIPSYNRLLPHIIPIISSYKSEGKTINVLKDVSDLYSWYYSLIKDINKSETDKQLVALVNNLIKDKKTDLEKAKAIYYWTQKNIKYIAFEYALGGFIPREANDVFKKKYGDCKDNSSILYEMLKIAGLEGNLTWIGTRTIPYTYNQVPTPMVDNHMILSIAIDNETYFLDATGRYLPIDMPSSFIQGKEALISKDPKSFEIKTVPIVPAKTNSFKELSKLYIDGDQLKGESTTELSGYYKIDFFNQLENENTTNKIKEYYNRKLRKGNNKFLIDSISEKNKFDYNNNLIVDYKFNIRDYTKNFNDEIYINLNLKQDISAYRTEDDRENDSEVKYQAYYEYTTILDIPEGYRVQYIPENFALETDYFNCSISYTINETSITYEHKLEMKFLNLNGQQQKENNKAIKLVEKNYKDIVILKKS
ncbi:DUF3857 domain-containing protein [Sediminibacter sp. Hel_I_10]|uniref:DUF3857 domain-containing protein n=1 Tax=Sediminibacter sp. Hel_I_10 TaxID=1392490 RepID=UPI00056928D9|nr:DUF3857 domain-containing protein [Sediminibacter sp. Hel_I_10]